MKGLFLYGLKSRIIIAIDSITLFKFAPIFIKKTYEMKEHKLTDKGVFRWKQFNRKGYAVFFSLKKEVNIGVLAIPTLGFANVNTPLTQNETAAQLKIQISGEIEPPCTNALSNQMQMVGLAQSESRNDVQPAAQLSFKKPANQISVRGSTLFRLILSQTGDCSPPRLQFIYNLFYLFLIPDISKRMFVQMQFVQNDLFPINCNQNICCAIHNMYPLNN